jgi:aminopeptidase C
LFTWQVGQTTLSQIAQDVFDKMDMMFFFFDQVFEGADSGAPTHSLKRILEKPYSCFLLLNMMESSLRTGLFQIPFRQIS